ERLNRFHYPNITRTYDAAIFLMPPVNSIIRYVVGGCISMLRMVPSPNVACCTFCCTRQSGADGLFAACGMFCTGFGGACSSANGSSRCIAEIIDCCALLGF